MQTPLLLPLPPARLCYCQLTHTLCAESGFPYRSPCRTFLFKWVIFLPSILLFFILRILRPSCPSSLLFVSRYVPPSDHSCTDSLDIGFRDWGVLDGGEYLPILWMFLC